MTFNFIELFNAVAANEKALQDDYKPATSLEAKVNEDELGLDSLDVTLTYATLAEIYGISNELNSKWPVTTLGELEKFLLENKSRTPEDEYDSVAALMEGM